MSDTKTPETADALAVPMESLKRLSKDLKTASKVLSPTEARFLVDTYYQMQDNRMRADGQIRALNTSGEPHSTIDWLSDNARTLENNLKSALDSYSSASLTGRWSKSITGIGPIIAAGLLAHIDITKAPTVGHIWSFAGLNANVEWYGTKAAGELIIAANNAESSPAHAVFWLARATKRRISDLYVVMGHEMTTRSHALAVLLTLAPSGMADEVQATFDRFPLHVDNAINNVAETFSLNLFTIYDTLYGDLKPDFQKLKQLFAKRPWNASLKTLCWKIGESFVKVSTNKDDVYGHVYAARKVQEVEKSGAGDFADQATAKLQKFKIGKDTQARAAYEKGQLPPAHLHARAKRYAVKLFLSAWHEVAYYDHYKTMPPKPYVIEHMGHVHYFEVPNLELVPGLRALKEMAKQKQA